MTDPDNPKTLNKKTEKIAGETTNEMLDKLRAKIKGDSGVEWTREQVKSKIQYAKKQYHKANDLRKATGEGNDTATLRSRMLATCPYFDRFHAVYDDSLARNPPPPRQSINYPSDTAIDMESEDETNDLEEFGSDEAIMTIGECKGSHVFYF